MQVGQTYKAIKITTMGTALDVIRLRVSRANFIISAKIAVSHRRLAIRVHLPPVKHVLLFASRALRARSLCAPRVIHVTRVIHVPLFVGQSVGSRFVQSVLLLPPLRLLLRF